MFAGYCDPRTRFLGLMPMQLKGVAQTIQSRVTMRDDVPRPSVYVGWPEGPTAGAVTTIAGPALQGPSSVANCGAGEAMPDLVRCRVALDLPFGHQGVTTPRIDPTTINRRTDPCGIQMANFQNILRGGYERSDMVTRLNALAKQIGIPEQMVSVDMTAIEFGKAFQIWKAISWLSYRDRCVIQNGNPTDSVTAAHKEPYGLWKLLDDDSTLYTCGASDNPFGVTMGKKTMPFELSRWMVGGADDTKPIDVDVHPIEFYEALNDELHCIALRYREWNYNGKPKIVIPTGTWLDFVRGYVYGSLGLGTFTNYGASTRDELAASIASGTINTRDFGPVTVIEDDCLQHNLTTGAVGTSTALGSGGATVTATAGHTYIRPQFMPDGPVGGEEAIGIEYMGYDMSGQTELVKVTDADTAEDGRQWGRFRIIEQRDGACMWWIIESNKRVVPNYPMLTGTIGTFGVRAQTCNPS